MSSVRSSDLARAVDGIVVSDGLLDDWVVVAQREGAGTAKHVCGVGVVLLL